MAGRHLKATGHYLDYTSLTHAFAHGLVPAKECSWLPDSQPGSVAQSA